MGRGAWDGIGWRPRCGRRRLGRVPNVALARSCSRASATRRRRKWRELPTWQSERGNEPVSRGNKNYYPQAWYARRSKEIASATLSGAQPFTRALALNEPSLARPPLCTSSLTRLDPIPLVTTLQGNHQKGQHGHIVLELTRPRAARDAAPLPVPVAVHDHGE